MSELWPWGRPLTWPQLVTGERGLRLVADLESRSAVARELDLESLTRLVADITTRPWLDGVEIEGRVEATLTRMCGVSLEPFELIADESLKIRVVPAGSPNAPRPGGQEVVVDIEAEDPPDEAYEDVIDLTAYVVEALALSLDPFPRKPGAVFTPPEPTGPISPFAVLAKLSRPPSSD